MNVQIVTGIKEIKTSMVITRCRCGNPLTHPGQICPKGKEEDKGVVGYWSSNPMRNWAWRIKKWLML